MQKVTYEIDDINWYTNDECYSYLKNINGIISVNIKKDFYPLFTITYNENVISHKIVFYEICTFLNIPYNHSVLSFNYYPKDAKTYLLNLKGLCCDFCYRNLIEELFQTNGILAVNERYEKHFIGNNFKENLKIKYDDRIISELEIKELERKIRNTYC